MVHIKKENRMGMENINGKTVNIIKDNG